ncbi:MAG: hypothetical protein ACYDGW_08190 [Vulcanimicrobiaceae bacterium]
MLLMLSSSHVYGIIGPQQERCETLLLRSSGVINRIARYVDSTMRNQAINNRE